MHLAEARAPAPNMEEVLKSSGIEASARKSSGIEASRARPITFARSAVHCHEPITALGEALP